MTREEMQRRLESAEKQNLGLQDEIKWLKEKLAEQDKQEIPDFPEFNRGDIVYNLDPCFDVIEENHGGGKGDKDFTGYDARYYNDFHTADYAHEFRRKCLMIAMVLHCKWYLDRDYVPDYTNLSEDKYFLFYDHVDGCFKYGFDCVIDNGSISFSDETAAQKCANWLNAHWKESTENLT